MLEYPTHKKKHGPVVNAIALILLLLCILALVGAFGGPTISVQTPTWLMDIFRGLRDATILVVGLIIMIAIAIGVANANRPQPPIPCEWCGGKGVIVDINGVAHYCEICHGTGKKPNSHVGQGSTACEYCNEGIVKDKNGVAHYCKICHGTGRKPEKPSYQY